MIVSVSDFNLRFPNIENIPTQKWFKIQISQNNEGNNEGNFQVTIDGETKISQVNPQPLIYGNIRVYAGDPLYPAANAKIKNLKVNCDLD